MSELAMLNEQESNQRLLLRTDRPYFQLRASSTFLSLPGLRGLWSMSAIQSNGDAFDQSGNGRLLTYNGNPTYNQD